MEHCKGAGSNRSFVTTNYGIITYPNKEWKLIMDSSGLRVNGKILEEVDDFDYGKWSAQPSVMELLVQDRTFPNIRNLKELDTVVTGKLEHCEILAVVLYTGPMVCFNFFVDPVFKP